MRKVWMRTLVVTAALVAFAGAADAGVVVKVDLSQQRMTVDVDGKSLHSWAVSTANSQYVTPTGTYQPQRMHKMWYSRKYDDAPMPNAIFYSGGFAIHGTGSVGMLGRPASHGCVRLAPSNAAALFALVQQKGMGATRIVIHGTPPKYREPAVAQRRPVEQGRVVRASSNEPGLLSGLFGWSQPEYGTSYSQPVRIERSVVRPLRPIR